MEQRITVEQIVISQHSGEGCLDREWHRDLARKRTRHHHATSSIQLISTLEIWCGYSRSGGKRLLQSYHEELDKYDTCSFSLTVLDLLLLRLFLLLHS